MSNASLASVCECIIPSATKHYFVGKMQCNMDCMNLQGLDTFCRQHLTRRNIKRICSPHYCDNIWHPSWMELYMNNTCCVVTIERLAMGWLNLHIGVQMFYTLFDCKHGCINRCDKKSQFQFWNMVKYVNLSASVMGGNYVATYPFYRWGWYVRQKQGGCFACWWPSIYHQKT